MERGEPAVSKLEIRPEEGPGDSFHIVQVETVGQFPKWPSLKCIKEEPEEGLLSQSWDAQWKDFLKVVQPPHSSMESPQLLEAVSWRGNTKVSVIPVEGPTATSEEARGDEQMAQVTQSLRRPAKQKYGLPDPRDREDYGKVKEERERALSTDRERCLFRQFSYGEAEGPREVYRQLHTLCHRWLKPEKRTKEQILEVLILEQFLAVLPQEMQKWVKESCPETSSQGVALAEDFLLRQQEAERQEEEVVSLIQGVAVSFPDAERASSETAQRWLIREIKKGRGKDAKLPDGWMSDSDRELQGMLAKRTQSLESFFNEDESKRDEGREDGRGKSTIGQESSVCKITLQERIHKGKGRSLCTLCGKSFSTKSSFNRHQRIHTGEKPYECPDCSESFLARSNLIRHQRIHTGEKPYKCSDCGKRFSRSANLITHQRSHTGEKPYKCLGCGKMFNQSAHLMRHQRTHVREKPYECADCGKGFTQDTALTGHQRIHTGEKPYECSDCSMKFRDKSSLNRHQRLHTGEKPYKCSECWKAFSSRSVLIRHQRTHMTEKPSKGSECSQTFLTISDLVTHQRTHTGEEIV
ncbi:zinc finger and SCAN domain-containing protein 2-like isoform X2 [Rhineura floridana]|uniref:zinc finger and SCAN domain-containing protein 2-like isoform X2 n=1 Tax=Rhineura floridana TaxID=261503 RepID=UPI002AC862FD|nr:zinc finger and SCAN domain-containing protein 2-like isoform X2 [Rhineura floridana]